MTVLSIPATCLVVLIGASGAGKSTLARRLFRPSEILSSDALRAMVRDDENDLAATDDAFETLHFILRKRLAAGLLTVVDATNVRAEDRAELVQIARSFHVLPVALVLDVGVRACLAHNEGRPGRANSRPYVLRQHGALRAGLRNLAREGFRIVHVVGSPEEASTLALERTRLHADRRDERGPFDLIGDVHGCFDELTELLAKLGYVEVDGVPRHPSRRVIFLGDLVDRGPRSIACLSLAKAMVEAGAALMVPGNHEMKLLRALSGRQVKVSHGLEKTLAELDALEPENRTNLAQTLAAFIDSLVSHLVLEDGRLVVAHAGMKESMQMRASGAVREFALYGDTTGEIDEYGLPVRANWALDYRGRATVVYGHTPTLEAEWLNNTLCIDTGCCFGGKLTALRYPENELVSVAAKRQYWEPKRPLAPAEPARPAQAVDDDLLDLGDLLGKRIVATRLVPSIVIAEGQAAHGLEALSRFAVHPRWLVTLPPTMSPVESSDEPGLLEHPREAFAYFRAHLPAERQRVVCEEKHMGSRALVAVLRSPDVARSRFGFPAPAAGRVFSRSGRSFFHDEVVEAALLEVVRAAAESAGLFDELATDWLVLDAELMPWSTKAQDLLAHQYAPVACAGEASLDAASRALRDAAARGLEVEDLRGRVATRRSAVGAYREAFRRYAWPVTSVTDLRLAVFAVLASEGRAHDETEHTTHLAWARRLAARDPSGVLLPTEAVEVDLTRAEDEVRATAWWWERVRSGGEGMVVKPAVPSTRGPRGLVQPGLKVRGPEYLRIIYGPTYDEPENLARLRQRSVGRKRSLAIRQHALGMEALGRFVQREPLRRVHECVLGVLALDDESIDPGL